MHYKIMLLVCLGFLQSCVMFTPKDAFGTGSESGCALVSRTKTLDTKLIDPSVSGDCRGVDCLFIPALISAGSLVVSGSIVLVSNILHWSEYQGKCPKTEPLAVDSCLLECSGSTGECKCIGEK